MAFLLMVEVTVDCNNSKIEASLNGIAFFMSSKVKVSPRLPFSIRVSANALAKFVVLFADAVCCNSSTNSPVTSS
jgi:hypothetical protein